jgi:hypothetical protein
MRLLLKHGADPKFVHHGDRMVEGRGEAFQHRTDVTTALMAATGMGGGRAWVPPARTARSLTLEAVTLAVELGVDVKRGQHRRPDGTRAAQAPEITLSIAFLEARRERAEVRRQSASSTRGSGLGARDSGLGGSGSGLRARGSGLETGDLMCG